MSSFPDVNMLERSVAEFCNGATGTELKVFTRNKMSFQ
jgi:hypothetical protein